MEKAKIDKQMFKEDTPQQRLIMLRDNCYKSEKMQYQKHFTDDEVTQFKHELSNCMIQLNEIDVEYQQIKEGFSNRTKPIKQTLKTLLEHIKYRSESVTEEVYLFDYQKEGIMAIYNAEGDLIEIKNRC